MNLGVGFFATNIMLGVRLAMDALSVGFTIADYNSVSALIAALIIATKFNKK